MTTGCLAATASWVSDGEGVGLGFVVSEKLEGEYSFRSAPPGSLARNIAPSHPLQHRVGRHFGGCRCSSELKSWDADGSLDGKAQVASCFVNVVFE